MLPGGQVDQDRSKAYFSINSIIRITSIGCVRKLHKLHKLYHPRIIGECEKDPLFRTLEERGKKDSDWRDTVNEDPFT